MDTAISYREAGQSELSTHGTRKYQVFKEKGKQNILAENNPGNPEQCADCSISGSPEVLRNIHTQIYFNIFFLILIFKTDYSTLAFTNLSSMHSSLLPVKHYM